MAIVIESKEKKGANWFAILIIFISIIIIGVAAYFLFFSKTPLIENIISQQLDVTSQLSQIQIDPQSITQNKIFQSLETYATLLAPSLSAIGKANPFTK